MRKDIAKVVNDKGKGSPRRETIKTRRKLDIKNLREEDQNSVSRAPESRRRQYGYAAKRHDSNFKPIDRFLRKNVGQHWNKIFSEICSMSADIRTRETILEYVEREVVTTTRLEGKQVVKPNRWFNSKHDFEKTLWVPVDDELYVHPKSGCLQLADPLPPNEERRRHYLARDVGDIWIDENTQYRCEREGYRDDNGKYQTKEVWYKVRWGTVTQGMISNQPYGEPLSKVGARYEKSKAKATAAEVKEAEHQVSIERQWILKTGKRDKSTQGIHYSYHSYW